MKMNQKQNDEVRYYIKNNELTEDYDRSGSYELTESRLEIRAQVTAQQVFDKIRELDPSNPVNLISINNITHRVVVCFKKKESSHQLLKYLGSTNWDIRIL